MIIAIVRPIIASLKKTELASALACRLTRITGKTNIPTHPKHLVDIGQYYYLPFLKKSDMCLDIGCSNGRYSIHLAQHTRRVIALDIDGRQLKNAEFLAHEKGIRNIAFLKYNVENFLPFQDNTFTVVLMFAVLEHLWRRNQVLREVCRILKPGGKLFLSIPNRNTTWKKIQRRYKISSYSDPDHKIEYSLDEIRNILMKHNFVINFMDFGGIDLPFTGMIDLIGGIHLGLYQWLTKCRMRKARQYPQEAVGFKFVCLNSK